MTQLNITGALAAVAKNVAAVAPKIETDAALLAAAQTLIAAQIAALETAGKFNGAQVTMAVDNAGVMRSVFTVTPVNLILS